jgi:hypothetical protein
MKKKTLLLLLLCAPTASLWLAIGAVPAPLGGRDAIPIAALWKGGRQTPGDKAATGIAFFMPGVRPLVDVGSAGSDPSLDLSDLDVRDSQNRSIKSPSASQELEVLFRENLINLMVFDNLHVTTVALSWLDSLSHLFNKSILTKLSITFGALQDVFLPPSRRFVHNVHNLCITFSVGAFAGCLLLSAFTLQRSPRRVYLRC